MLDRIASLNIKITLVNTELVNEPQNAQQSDN